MVSTVLAAVWDLTWSRWNPVINNLWKGWVIVYNFVYSTHRLFWHIQTIENISSVKMHALTEYHHLNSYHHRGSTWSVFILNTISTFLKQFSKFVNIFLLKDPFCTHHLLFCKFHITTNKNLLTDLCPSMVNCIWFVTILNSLKTYISVRLNLC